jgi:hypothetical protein
MQWHWHIFEGISGVLRHAGNTPMPTTMASSEQFWRGLLRLDTINPDMHRNGLSVDGTTEYLDELSRHPHVTVYRVGTDWDKTYLTARFQHMLNKVSVPTLAWQVDADEYWTAAQIETMESMFAEQPSKTAAWFRCRFFVGPRLMLPRSDCSPGGRITHEWRRVWVHRPGCVYTQHDPPTIVDENGVDVFTKNPFMHAETEAAGLVFNHYAYVTEAQVRFKERRYSFCGAMDEWRRLQTSELPARMDVLVGGNGGGACPVIAAPQEYWFMEA